MYLSIYQLIYLSKFIYIYIYISIFFYLSDTKDGETDQTPTYILCHIPLSQFKSQLIVNVLLDTL